MNFKFKSIFFFFFFSSLGGGHFATSRSTENDITGAQVSVNDQSCGSTLRSFSVDKKWQNGRHLRWRGSRCILLLTSYSTIARLIRIPFGLAGRIENIAKTIFTLTSLWKTWSWLPVEQITNSQIHIALVVLICLRPFSNVTNKVLIYRPGLFLMATVWPHGSLRLRGTKL